MIDLPMEVWRRSCRARAFEQQLIVAHRAGKLAPAPIYLSIGTEHVAAAASVICADWHLFTQHRCHSWYLSYGGSATALRAELLGTGGCAGGMAGSASLHWPPAPIAIEAGLRPYMPMISPRMWGHSGLLGDQIPIAVGMALASGRLTLAVLGDAAVEEDYVLASFGFASSKKLPILFVVEDNGLSILTKTEVRRSWRAVDAARGLGLAADEVGDDPLELLATLKQVSQHLPFLLNIKVCRHHWHAGPGTDGPPAWDALRALRSYLNAHSLTIEAHKHYSDALAEMEALWQL